MVDKCLRAPPLCCPPLLRVLQSQVMHMAAALTALSLVAV